MQLLRQVNTQSFLGLAAELDDYPVCSEHLGQHPFLFKYFNFCLMSLITALSRISAQVETPSRSCLSKVTGGLALRQTVVCLPSGIVQISPFSDQLFF